MLAVIAGILFAAWTLINKAVVADVGGMWLGFSNLGIAGLVLAPWALLAEWGEPQASWSWLLVLGLGMTALLGRSTSWCWTACRRRPPASCSTWSPCRPCSWPGSSSARNRAP